MIQTLMASRAISFQAAEWQPLLREFLAFKRFDSANITTHRHS